MKTLNTNKAIGKCIFVMLQVLESLEKGLKITQKRLIIQICERSELRLFSNFRAKNQHKLEFFVFFGVKIQIFKK